MLFRSFVRDRLDRAHGDLSWSYGLAVRLMLRQVDLLWERGMLDYLLLHGSKPAAGPGRG